jgi:PilZ domain-containing protein
LYNKTDRRKYTRFNVPGAKVKYDEEKDFQGSEGFTGLGKMIDLTIYAVKFETQHKLTPGAKIQIWITLDDNKNIPMVGNVLWIFSEKNNHPKNATVGFNAFSKEKGFNSIESKKALEYLSEQYEPASTNVIFNF